MSATAVARRNLPARMVDVWEYISPSRLNLWLKCPLAFRFKYIDGIEAPASKAQVVGKRVHSALEYYYRHRQVGVKLSSEEVCRRLPSLWDSLESEAVEQAADEELENAARHQAIGLVKAYVSQVPEQEPKPLAVESSLEAPLIDSFTGENLGIPLVGIIDLVMPAEKEPLIVDFKTAARGGELPQIVHEIQLSSYAYRLRYAYGQTESGLEVRSLIKTKTPRIETHRYPRREERHLRRLFAVIRAYLDDLDRGRFVYRPSQACAMCEHRDRRCAAWKG